PPEAGFIQHPLKAIAPPLFAEFFLAQRCNEIQQMRFPCVVPPDYHIYRCDGIKPSPIMFETSVPSKMDGIGNHSLSAFLTSIFPVTAAVISAVRYSCNRST